MKQKLILPCLTAFLILWSYIKVQASVGLADWLATTPGGNEIEHNGCMYLNLRNDSTLDCLEEFYFYNNHIIGTYAADTPGADRTLHFFVANEATGEIKRFNKEDAWQDHIKSNELKPWIWARWHGNSWKSIDNYLFYFPFCVLLFIFGVKLIVNVALRNKLSFKQKNVRIFIALAVILLVKYLTFTFPQSI